MTQAAAALVAFLLIGFEVTIPDVGQEVGRYARAVVAHLRADFAILQ